MNCPHCSVSLADDTAVCPSCGAPQSLPATPNAPVPAAPPKTRRPRKAPVAKAKAELPKEPEEAEESEEPGETKPGAAGHSRLGWLRRGLITWVIVFTLGFFAERVVDFAFKDGPAKLAEENKRVGEALAAMRPWTVAGRFYSRLTEAHGWTPYQWDAPFNAAEARRRLDTKYQRQAAAVGDIFPDVPSAERFPYMTPLSSLPTTVIPVAPPAAPAKLDYFLSPHPRRVRTIDLQNIKDWDGILTKKTAVLPLSKAGFGSSQAEIERALSSVPLPPPVLPSAVPAAPDPIAAAAEARRQKRQAAYQAEKDKIDHYALPAELNFGGRGGYLSVFVGGTLSLLDAYLFTVRGFLPHLPLPVLLALVSIVLALTISLYSKYSKEPSLGVLLIALLALPLGISAVSWLLWELGEGMTLAFQSVLTAPMLNTVSTSAVTPVVAWFSGKAAEHSLVERTLEHGLIKRLMGIAGAGE